MSCLEGFVVSLMGLTETLYSDTPEDGPAWLGVVTHIFTGQNQNCFYTNVRFYEG